MILVTVDNGTCRELVIILFAIQRLFDAAIVFLAFFISLSVFKEDSFLVFLPIVTIVGIKMPFVKTEFGQQNGVSRQLIEIIQQGNGSVVDHIKEIEIWRIMCKFHFSLLVCTEIIFTRFEGIPHHTIAIGRPIEWRRRSYSTVSPTILVYNINGFSFV